MKHFWTALTLTLLVVGLAACSAPAAQAPETVVTPAVPGVAEEAPPPSTGITTPFLWQVQGRGKPVYLLGTVHLGVDGRKELPPSVWTAFEGSGTLVMEADITAINPFELSKYVTLPPGESLKKMISPAAWDMLVRELPLFPAAVLERSRPWLVSVSLLETRYPTATPMDQAFLTEARDADKKMVFLETWQQQLGMLNATPSTYWVEGIEQLVGGTDELEAKMDELLAAYRSGDEGAASKVLFEDELLDKHPDLKETMFVGRNRRWIPALVAVIESGEGAFVAAGLGHFLGPEGVVELLVQRGYTVERVAVQ